MLRALHDESITEARDLFISGRGVAAIMGGHKLSRTDPVYASVAQLARSLTRRGYLMASGGGPGAMEATHLGALLAPHDDAALDVALDQLGREAAFPEGMGQVVASDRTVDRSLVSTLHRWQRPAFGVLRGLAGTPVGESLAIPTWFYGHEPPTPFATHIAKYFHNAIREDGLLAIAHHGIVYAPGRAGTLQEVFQDAAQNYYSSFGGFAPMVFFDVGGVWTKTFPVGPVLEPLFGAERMERHVLFTTEIAAAERFLVEHDGTHP